MNARLTTLKQLIEKYKVRVAIGIIILTVVAIFIANNQSNYFNARHSSSSANSSYTQPETYTEDIVNNNGDSELENRVTKLKGKIEQSKVSHTFTHEDNDGYKFEIEVTMTGFIKGDDTDLLTAAWRSVDDTSSGVFTDSTERDIAAFGRFTVRNVTPGFSFTPEKPYQQSKTANKLGGTIGVDGKYDRSSTEGYRMPKPVRYMYYSSGKDKTDLNATSVGIDRYIFPAMKSDVWSAPFALVYEKVVTPKEPEGSPAFNDAYLYSCYVTYCAEEDTWQKVNKLW